MEHCEKYIQWISSHMDDALEYQEEAELFFHLETCPLCRQLADNYQIMSEAISQTEAEPPATLLKGVMARIDTESRERSREARRRPIRRFLAVAAVFAVLVAMGVYGVWDGLMPTGNFDFMAPAPTQAEQAAGEPLPAAEAPAAEEDFPYLRDATREGSEDVFPYAEEDEGADETATPLAESFYAGDLIVNSELLDEYLSWAGLSWDALSRAIEEAGFHYRVYENAFFVSDPQNPDSYLYGILDDDFPLVLVLGYRLLLGAVDRRVEIRLGSGGLSYHYAVAQVQEGGILTTEREQLRDFILFG